MYILGDEITLMYFGLREDFFDAVSNPNFDHILPYINIVPNRPYKKKM